MSDAKKTTLLIDAHVHVYDCFDVDKLFDSALQNFNHAANVMGYGDDFIAVMLLSETSQDNWFAQATVANKNSRWTIEETQEKTVLKVNLRTDLAGEKNLYVIAGRQIITDEGLELLALLTDSSFEDGLSMRDALTAVREQDAIPVLPWAVGKWLGKRGKILSALLETEIGSDLRLGDNSGRPIFWKNPAHFKQARKIAMPILPGTDPLPFADEVMRVGNFGFSVTGKVDQTRLAYNLKCLLRNTETVIQAYGSLEKPWRFITNQIHLRRQ